MGTMRRQMRFEMPELLLRAFIEEPRIVVDPAPGLWPVDLRVMPHLEKLLHDAEFNERFEVLIVPR